MILDMDKTTGELKISGTLDIDATNSLRDALLDCLLHQPEVGVDLSEVDACDAAALQILFAARRDSAAAGKAFRATASEAVTGVAEALGLSFGEDARAN
jgi:anti-anti-sigma regulatory factor